MGFYTIERLNACHAAVVELLKDRKVKDCEVFIKKADDRDDYITVERGHHLIGLFNEGDFRMLESTLNLLKNKHSSYSSNLMLGTNNEKAEDSK